MEKAAQADEKKVQQFSERFHRHYAYENDVLRKNKYSVSELKHRAMREAFEKEEESVPVFKSEEVVPYVPAFARKIEQESEEVNLGALRGTAMHRIMECYQFSSGMSAKEQVAGMLENEQITPEMKEKLADFYGNYASEKETADTIRDLYEKTGYVIDTHTAVAASVYHKYKKDTNDTDTKTVIASTASPFKFSRSVMDAIDPKYDSLSEFELVDELSRIGNVKIPQAIEEIRSAEVRHKTVCEVEEMPEVVKQFLGI